MLLLQLFIISFAVLAKEDILFLLQRTNVECRLSAASVVLYLFCVTRDATEVAGLPFGLAVLGIIVFFCHVRIDRKYPVRNIRIIDATTTITPAAADAAFVT